MLSFRCLVIFENKDHSQGEISYLAMAPAADLAADMVEGEFKRTHPAATILYSEAVQI